MPRSRNGRPLTGGEFEAAGQIEGWILLARADLLFERLLALPIDDAANSCPIDRARSRRRARPTCRVCSARGTRVLWLGGDGEIAEKR
jgi:hypothetical protein